MPVTESNIPQWEYPPASTKDFDYADLKTLDLSQITGENFEIVPDEVVSVIGDALSRDGFIYASNHGLSEDEVLRQFSIGKFAFDNVPESDKHAYRAKILETGSYVGYKPRGHWKLHGVSDQIEHFSVNSQSFGVEARKRVFPPAFQSLVDEIEAFTTYNYQNIYRKVLTVLSLILKLPSDYLWKLNKDRSKRFDLFRYALYHAASSEDDRKTGNVRLQGHTDFNSVSLLYSQPIVSLQVLMPDDIWRYVRHVPNTLVINLGDAMHFLSGGYLKQTIHRVVAAPDEEQASYRRLGVFYFAHFDEDVPLLPLAESPVVHSTGKRFFEDSISQGLPVPTAGDWESNRVKAYGQDGKKKKLLSGHEEEVIAGGEKIVHYN